MTNKLKLHPGRYLIPLEGLPTCRHCDGAAALTLHLYWGGFSTGRDYVHKDKCIEVQCVHRVRYDSLAACAICENST